MGEFRNGVHCMKNGMEVITFVAVCKDERALWDQWLGHPSYCSLCTLSGIHGFELNKGLKRCLL